MNQEIIDKMDGARLTPIKAIKAYCIDCCGGNRKEVKLCPSNDCTLWPYRFGKNPYNTRIVSEEQKEQARIRMKALRQRQLDSE